MLLFYLGALFGSAAGIFYMSLLQINKPDHWKEVNHGKSKDS